MTKFNNKDRSPSYSTTNQQSQQRGMLRNLGINSHWGMSNTGNTGSIGSTRPKDDYDDENANARNDEHYNRGTSSMEDQCFKKQMEFKGGKLHQLITDQITNSNMIFANRYQGLLGVWYFIIDSSFHFENVLSLLLFVIIQINEFDMISI